MTVIEHKVPMAHAAEVLGVTERHAWRILAAYRKEGAAALAHGNRGRQPPNAVSNELAAAVVNLAGNTYSGANHTHLTDLLREREGIDLGRQTVRRILTKAGMPSPRRRRPPKHRVRRERMPQAGMLIQVDGSHHPWLEERGPRFALLLAVDDATGVVANAVFRQAEGTRGYFLLMAGLIRRWESPWPCTPTATASSSSATVPSMCLAPWNPPTSPAPCGSWECSRYSLAHPKPRAGWSALPAPSKTAS